VHTTKNRSGWYEQLITRTIVITFHTSECDAQGNLNQKVSKNIPHVFKGFVYWSLEWNFRNHWSSSLRVTEFFTSVWNVCQCWRTPLSAAIIVWSVVVLLISFFKHGWNLQLNCVVEVNFLIREKPNTVWCLTLWPGSKAVNKGLNPWQKKKKHYVNHWHWLVSDL
jgi:hypothetical protein